MHGKDILSFSSKDDINIIIDSIHDILNEVSSKIDEGIKNQPAFSEANHYKSSNHIPTIIDSIREYKLDFISNEWKDTSKMYTTRMFSVSEQEFYEKE